MVQLASLLAAEKEVFVDEFSGGHEKSAGESVALTASVAEKRSATFRGRED
jgi:hypothetical protein